MSFGERASNKANHRGKDYWKCIGIFHRIGQSMTSVSNNAGVNKFGKKLSHKQYRQQEKRLIRIEE